MQSIYTDIRSLCYPITSRPSAAALAKNFSQGSACYDKPVFTPPGQSWHQCLMDHHEPALRGRRHPPLLGLSHRSTTEFSAMLQIGRLRILGRTDRRQEPRIAYVYGLEPPADDLGPRSIHCSLNKAPDICSSQLLL